jgi:protein AroM
MSPRPILGLVTIGQTPRPDILAVFGAAAPHAALRLAGALDGLSLREVGALAAAGGEYPLLVRLADGGAAEVPMAHLHPRVEACARRLAAEGAAAVVVLCAGGFPDVRCDVPVVLPGVLVPAVVRGLVGTGPVGVVTPNAAQVPFAERKWRGDGFAARVTYASPVGHDEIARAAAALSDPALRLVVLDCMGHDDAYRAEFARLCGRPVIAAQSLVARVAGALI